MPRNSASPHRIGRAQPHQPTAQLIAERVANRVEEAVVVERLAARGRSQLRGVDHAAREERPLRQQPFGALGEQHPLQVDAMPDAAGRIRRNRQHERHAAQASLRHRSGRSRRTGPCPGWYAHSRSARHAGQPPATAARTLVVAARPSTSTSTGSRSPKSPDQLEDSRVGQPVLGAPAGHQGDGGADLRPRSAAIATRSGRRRTRSRPRSGDRRRGSVRVPRRRP